MVNEKKKIEEMIRQGSIIFVPEKAELLLAGLLWLENPQRIRWCGVFPTAQNHVHEIAYDKIVEDDEDGWMVFWSNEKPVAAVIPMIDTTLDVSAVRNTWKRWKSVLKEYDNKAKFERFLETA